MKTYLTYGAGMAIAGTLLTLVFFLLGYHSDVAKMQSTQSIGTALSVAIWIAGIVLGIRARRAETPPTEEFGYGRALGAGVMISLFAALIGVATSYLYFGIINPAFSDVIAELQIAEMERKNVPPEAQEAAQKFMSFFRRPAVMAFSSFFTVMIAGVIVSLIAAAFLRRRAAAELPPPVNA